MVLRIKSISLQVVIFYFSICALHGKSKCNYSTQDVTLFWNAFQQLARAKTFEDSVQCIQVHYLNKASKPFRKWIRQNNFSAQEYVSLIHVYPKFWNSLHKRMAANPLQVSMIESLFQAYQQIFPTFKRPSIYIGIGCLRSGGTTSKHHVLICADIAASDSLVDLSELPDELKSILGRNDLLSYLAHETAHTLQHGFPWQELPMLLRHKRLTVLNMCLVEGSADFFSHLVIQRHINTDKHIYGETHEQEIWKMFNWSVENHRFDYSPWLYNFRQVKGMPSDLGYYIGYKIAESFYQQQANKLHALRMLQRRGKYRKIVGKSKYSYLNKLKGPQKGKN